MQNAAIVHASSVFRESATKNEKKNEEKEKRRWLDKVDPIKRGLIPGGHLFCSAFFMCPQILGSAGLPRDVGCLGTHAGPIVNTGKFQPGVLGCLSIQTIKKERQSMAQRLNIKSK